MKEKEIIIMDEEVEVIRAPIFKPMPKIENSITWDLRYHHLNDLMLIPKSWSFWKKLKYIWRGGD